MGRLGIATYEAWSTMSRKERVNWLAFMGVERDVEGYGVVADELDAVGFTLGDWRRADEQTRMLKVKQGREQLKQAR